MKEAKTQSEQHKVEIQLLQDRLHLESDETFRRKKTFHMVSWKSALFDIYCALPTPVYSLALGLRPVSLCSSQVWQLQEFVSIVSNSVQSQFVNS